MASYGYLAFLIRVAPPHRDRALQRLNSVGDSGRDLLEELQAELRGLGDRFHRNEARAEGFRIKKVKRYGRSLFIRLRRGPVGSPGETYDVELGEATETTETIALLGELRAGVYLPEDSYYGFLFLERSGGRHVKDLIYTRAIVPVAKRLNVLVRVEAYAESDDWRRELAGQQVLRVTEVLRPTDSASDASTVDDLTVRVSAEGASLRHISADIKERVQDLIDRRHKTYRVLADMAPLESRRKVWGTVQKRTGEQVEKWKAAPRSVFTVADAEELDALKLELERLKAGPDVAALLDQLRAVIPVDREELESRRLEVGLGTDKPHRAIVVEGDRLPQLVYPMQARLTNIELQRTWDAQAEHFFETLGVARPAGWLDNRN